MASKRGVLTWTLQKVSKISFSYSSFLDFANLLGKDKEETLVVIKMLEMTISIEEPLMARIFPMMVRLSSSLKY